MEFTDEERNAMRVALTQARQGFEEGEVPVGAVVVRDGTIIGRGRDRREALKDPTAHAEILALREASEASKVWNLSGCWMAVTLEPCIMCAGALVAARIDRLVYGADNPRWGGVESLYRLLEDARLNHRLESVGGLLAEDSAELMQRFFRNLR